MKYSILHEERQKLESLVGKTIHEVITTDSMLTVVTNDDVNVIINSEALFGSFCVFRYQEINQLVAKTITRITKREHGFMLHYNRDENQSAHAMIWALGIDTIKNIEFSSSREEMKIHFTSFGGFSNYPVYYRANELWHLSEFSEGNVAGGLQNLLKKVDLLSHPTVQEALKNHKRSN